VTFLIRFYYKLKNHACTAAHFDRWQMLFFETIDSIFEGEKVDDAKRRVEAMSMLIQHKIKASESKGFIQ